MLILDLDARGDPTGSSAGDAGLLARVAGSQDCFAPDGGIRALPSVIRETIRGALRDWDVTGGPAVRRIDGNRPDDTHALEISLVRRTPTDPAGGPAFSAVLRAVERPDAPRRHLARLAQVAAVTSRLVVVTDPMRRIVWVNDAFTRTTGYRLDEVVGRKPGELLQFEATDPETVRRLRLALDARQPVHAEILNRGKSGQVYWLSLDIQPVFDEHGTIDGFVAVQTDVSERKIEAQRQADLAGEAERARATLLAALAALPDGFALFGTDGGLVVRNDRFLDLHPKSTGLLDPGMTIAAMLREELARGEYPEARNRTEEWLDRKLRALADGTGWVAELELADGRWVRSAKLPIPGLGVIAVRSDITPLKQAEKAAVAQRLTTMEAARDGIAIADAQERLVHVNAALMRMFGNPDGDEGWIGRDWSQLCHSSERAATTAAAREAIADRGAWRGYLRGHGVTAGPPGREVSLTRAPDGSFVLIARDASQLHQELQAEIALRDVLMTIVSRYLNTPIEQVDAAIEAGLGQLANFIGADRAYLFEYDWDAGTTTNTHEWCAAGIAPQRATLQRVSLAAFPAWVEAHRAGRTMNIEDVARLPGDDGLRGFLEAQGIRSLIAIPVMDGVRCEGFLGFDSVRARHAYTDREQSLLRFFSEISRSLRGRARLEILSHEVGERLRLEEERRRLQEAAIRQRLDHDARMERTLVEMQRLHARERQLRAESEMLVRALRSLSEADDLAEGPQRLLRQLADAVGTGCVAILALQGQTDPLCLDRAQWWRAVQEEDAAIAYLAARPQRMIADLSASPLFPPIARSYPAGELHWMATARFELGDARFLLVVAGTRSDEMDQGRLQFLPRFVPLLSEALRRRSDSLRARRLEQDLRQAQKLEALGALAGSIAHEINTPMQYIGDNLHFLRDAFGDLVAALDAPGDAAGLAYLRHEVPQALEQSLSGCGRIAEIVEAVRTFAYPDLAQDEDVDIPTILRHCLVMTRSSWKHLVDIDLDFPARVPNVRGGPGQFSQVFVNLITNACHAVGTSPSAPGMVRITVAATADAVLVHVDDNGPGVPAGLRDRIFDQFFTTKELGKGTGQGLGISRGIVERYGGRIELGDSPMGGARFTVSVPLPG